MAISWRFFLDTLEIEEPIGFSSLELSIKRDDKMHGLQFEASTSELEFYGEAMEYLKEQKALNGVKANVIFTAKYRCNTGKFAEVAPVAGLPYTLPFVLEANEEEIYDEAMKGKLNFGKFKEVCGEYCSVSMPVESETCDVVLKNRFDQKVDIDKALGFDGFTVLPTYSEINTTRTLKAKELFVGAVGKVKEGGYTFDLSKIIIGGNPVVSLRPVFERATSNSIATGQVDIVSNEYGIDGPFGGVISPILLFEDIVSCFTGNFEVEIRLKGSYNFHVEDTSIQALRLMIFTTDDPTIASPNQVNHLIVDLPHGTSSGSGTFDSTYTGNTIGLPEGYGLYVVWALGAVGLPSDWGGSVTWDEDTSISVVANKVCPPTDVKMSLVHETLSRVAEAITDSCMRVKSSYYGRIDSEPFAFNIEGCGGLRFLTSGLKIRKAKEDSFFVSMKELVEGLQAIDNIGMGVEPDPDKPGMYLLRIEALPFFYQDKELLFHPSIPNAEYLTDETKYYSRILVGYKKWEVSQINGLDEYNSTREYRTSITSINNTLDLTSDLVAGSYPLEVARQQTFAKTGGADTSYDNETFIITGIRNAYGVEPEQGNINDAEDIYRPDTSYNWKINPVLNLMRWYKLIINSYANLTESDNKLFFNSGTGNFVAKGKVSPNSINEECILESKPIKQNQDLYVTDFARQPEYAPLYRNDNITYEYPMSIEDFKKLKADPYGYIRYQCGKGEIKKGYIKEVKFKLVSGMATFTLKKQW